jgi:hypothetical protein
VAFGFLRILNGLQLEPQNTTAPSLAGDVRYNSSSNNVQYYNGSGVLTFSTLTGTETLTNKTLTSPVLNTPTADTITGIAGGALTVESASNQNLVVKAQGTGTSLFSGAAGVTLSSTGSTVSVSAPSSSVSISASTTALLQGGGAVSVVSTGSTVSLLSNTSNGLTIDTSGNIVPSADNSLNLGSAAHPYAHAYLGTQLVVSATTNQISLGTTHTVTLNSVAPAASRTYTLPDAGTNSSFLMADGNQTLNGVQTFSLPLTLAQVSQPSTPASGYAKFYYSLADGNLHYINSAGIDQVVGSSGAVVVAMRAFIPSSAISAPTGTMVTLPYHAFSGITYTKDYDTNNALNATTGVYTVPVAGTYFIHGEVRFDNASASGERVILLTVTGSINKTFELCEVQNVTTSYPARVNGSIQLSLSAGDTIALTVYQDSGINVGIDGDSNGEETWFEAHRVSPVASASTPVVANYYLSSNVNPGLNTILNFNTKVIDTNNAVTTGPSWAFTAPFTGYYRVMTNICGDGNNGGGTIASVYLNGSQYSYIILTSVAQTFEILLSGSLVLPMNAGDTMNIVVYTTSTVVGAVGGIPLTQITVEQCH